MIGQADEAQIFYAFLLALDVALKITSLEK